MPINSKLSQTPQEGYQKMKEAGRTIARYDPQRPEFHFHSPGQWMDDPNGSVFHKGYYHIMYGANPDSYTNRGGMPYKTGSNKWSPEEPEWLDGIDAWGHARSRDLVHWEHLPMSVFPNPEKDEYFIWWGCTRINKKGVPTIIYTSVGHHRSPTDSADQFIAYGDDDLITWKQADALNPILSDAIHGGKKYYEWRDPYIFQNDGRVFLILGATDSLASDGRALVLLYETLDPEYSKWVFRGELFAYPGDLRSIECPNIDRFGDKWVLFVSPHGPVEYFVGDIDFNTYTFTWESRGVLNESTFFYATNLLFDDKDRCVLLGAIEGFKNTKGWNGAGALPRIAELRDGRIAQRVIPEIESLRSEKKEAKAGVLCFDHGTFELLLEIDDGDAGVLEFSYAGGGFQIPYGHGKIALVGFETKLIPRNGKSSVRIFFDKTVVELFADEFNALSAIVPVCAQSCEVYASAGSLTGWAYDASEIFTYYDD